VCVDKTLLSRNRGKRRERRERKSWASFPVSQGFNWPVGGREREGKRERQRKKDLDIISSKCLASWVTALTSFC